MVHNHTTEEYRAEKEAYIIRSCASAHRNGPRRYLDLIKPKPTHKKEPNNWRWPSMVLSHPRMLCLMLGRRSIKIPLGKSDGTRHGVRTSFKRISNNLSIFLVRSSLCPTTTAVQYRSSLTNCQALFLNCSRPNSAASLNALKARSSGDGFILSTIGASPSVVSNTLQI